MTPREVALAYWAAEMRRDIDGIVSFFHDDATFYTPAQTWSGVAEIRSRYVDMARTVPSLDVTVGWIVEDGPRAALQWHSVLTDAVGVHTVLDGVNLVEVVGERFVEVRCFFDPMVRS